MYILRIGDTRQEIKTTKRDLLEGATSERQLKNVFQFCNNRVKALLNDFLASDKQKIQITVNGIKCIIERH